MLSLPRNIYVISAAMAFSFTITSMMVLVAGILGAKIAPSPALATLPMAVLVIGTASATIPAALLMQRLGRKKGMALGMLAALAGVMLACYAAILADFKLLIGGAFLMGINAAFTQQGRFIIIENAINEKQAADGLTLGLMANLFAALIGPELGMRGEFLLGNEFSFAGSFVLGGVMLCLSLATLMMYQDLPKVTAIATSSKRSVMQLIRQPIFIMAAGSAALGYAVMALLMTATPISMHEFDGHSLGHTKTVIQAHIIAMFLPSLISGALLKRGYRARLIILGLLIYLIVIGVAFSGQQVTHYLSALLLLGLGWNLIFMTSTSLLPQAYVGDERFKAQASNDFLVFSMQAIASFSAGWLLFTISWSGILNIALFATTAWIGVVLIIAARLKAKARAITAA